MTKKTLFFPINPLAPEVEIINKCAAIIKRGGLVAFPTETVYGLGASILNEGALAEIFKVKGRPADNPLIIHLASAEELAAWASEIPPQASKLATAFWPGPLTLVLPRKKIIPGLACAHLPTAAFRVPAHKAALALIAAAGVPLAAPSANLSGRPSPTSAEHVRQDLAGKIDAIIDGGMTTIGLESTVIDLTVSPPVILRPGGISPEEISAVLEENVVVSGSEDYRVEQPRSPGMKYIHYAPRAPLYLVEGDLPAVQGFIRRRLADEVRQGHKVAVLCCRESRGLYQPLAEELVLGGYREVAEIAANLFAALRRCDEMGVDVVYSESFPQRGVGLAVMNRLRKAAGGRVITCDCD